MRNSLNQVHKNHEIDLEKQQPRFRTHVPNNRTGSSSDVGDQPGSETLNEFKSFFLENKPQPKFLRELDTCRRSLSPSNIGSSDYSESLEDSPANASPFRNKTKFPLSMYTDFGRHSSKNYTMTFNDMSPGSKKATSRLAVDTASVHQLRKQESVPVSDLNSVNQLMEVNEEGRVLINSTSTPTSPLPINSNPKNTSDPTDIQRSKASKTEPLESRLKGQKKARTNAIITRALIRAAFHRAIEDHKVFDPSSKELLLIKDKSYVPKTNNEEDTERRLQKPKAKDLPQLKIILQNHGLINENIKPGEIQQILKDMNKGRSFKEKVSRKVTIFKSTLKKKISFLHRFNKLIRFTIPPNSFFKIAWDIVSMVLIFYDLIMIPFLIGFDVVVDGFFLGFERFEDIYFILDLIINFHTAFFRDGLLVTDKMTIAKQYLKTWFAVDFIAVFTSSLIFDNIVVFDGDGGDNRSYAVRLLKFLRLIRFLRILRALKLKKIFNRIEDIVYSNIYISIKGIFSLLFYIALLAHLSACLWHFVGITFTDDLENTWLKKFSYDDLSVGDRYVISLFWAITTMLTVGYGDITPVNTLERIVNILIMLLGCGIFAYSMNKIGNLIHNFSDKSSYTRQMHYNMTKYLEKMNVTPNLRAKVGQYLNYMSESQNQAKLEEEQLFSLLSESLREEVKKDINGQLLRENTVLLKNFDSRFLSMISYKLEERTFSPGQLIFDEFDKSFSLYLVSKGVVEICIPRCDVVINQLQKEKHFGEQSFFTGRQRSECARSLTFSHIFSITKQEFLSLVEDFPREKEVFHFIKDKMDLYKDFSMLERNCTVCGVTNHDASECSRIHYIPNREALMDEFQNSQRSFFKNFKRKRRPSYNALFNQGQVASQALFYVERHPEEMKKILTKDVSRRSLRFVIPKDHEPNEKDEKGPKVKSRTTLNQISEEASQAEQIARKSIMKRISNISNLKGLSSKDSFCTDEEDYVNDDRRPPPKLPERQRVNFGEVHEYREFMRKASSGFNMKSPSYRQDSATPRSLIDEHVMRIMEGGYLIQELQKMEQQFTSLDMVCNYTIYFPHNNIKNILEDIEVHRKERKLEAKNRVLIPVMRKAISVNLGPRKGSDQIHDKNGSKTKSEKRLFGTKKEKTSGFDFLRQRRQTEKHSKE